MIEKAYKSMSSAGALNIVIGVCALVGGITSGVLLIVHGGRLLSNRKHILM